MKQQSKQLHKLPLLLKHFLDLYGYQKSTSHNPTTEIPAIKKRIWNITTLNFGSGVTVTVAVMVVLFTTVTYILFRKQVRAKETIKLHDLPQSTNPVVT